MNFPSDPTTLMWIICLALSMGLFTYIAWLVQSRKHSLLVRIKSYPEKTKIVKQNGDNTIQIYKKKRKQTGWKAKYTRNCLVPLRGVFSPPYALDIFPYASKAIEYKWELRKTDQPKYDKQASQEFNDAEILKNRGKGLESKTPIGIWIVVILVIVSLVLQFAQMRGIRLV